MRFGFCRFWTKCHGMVGLGFRDFRGSGCGFLRWFELRLHNAQLCDKFIST